MFIGAWDILELWDHMTMTFTSGYFLVFFAVVVFLYYMVSAKNQWIVLLIGSLFFGMAGGFQVILYPIVLAAIVYSAAVIIENTGEGRQKKKKLCLAVSILILAAVLILIKCAVKFDWKFMNLVFPVGISYYTFSMISYLADVYWGNDRAEKNFFRLLLFVMYFPKMLQGPISRHKNLAPQLKEKHCFSYRNLCFGLQLVVWGFFKKLVIAERAGIVASYVFGHYEDYGGGILFAATVLETIQLYCDFSGYMDIAAGISQTFGIVVEQNFNHPFFARSAEEVWRRWHITLGTWFKDYVYMPVAYVTSPGLAKAGGWVKKHIGKQAGKTVMTVIPLMSVWILTGLWHGTGLNYIVWGLYWGGGILLSTLFHKQIERFTKKLHIHTESPSWRRFQMVRTFLLFCLSQLIIVPGDLKVSFTILKKFVGDLRIWELVNGTIYTIDLDRVNFQLMLLCIGILWMVSILQEKKISIRESVANWNFAFRCFFYCAAVWSIMIFGLYGPDYDANAFLYMNF